MIISITVAAMRLIVTDFTGACCCSTTNLTGSTDPNDPPIPDLSTATDPTEACNTTRPTGSTDPGDPPTPDLTTPPQPDAPNCPILPQGRSILPQGCSAIALLLIVSIVVLGAVIGYKNPIS